MEGKKVEAHPLCIPRVLFNAVIIQVSETQVKGYLVISKNYQQVVVSNDLRM